MNYRISYSNEAKRCAATPARSLSPTRTARDRSVARNPRPAGAVELRDLPGMYRIWLNGRRIIYQVNDDDAMLLIIGIRYKTGPETYEDLEIG